VRSLCRRYRNFGAIGRGGLRILERERVVGNRATP